MRTLSARPLAILASAALAPLAVILVPAATSSSAATGAGHGPNGHGSDPPLTAATILSGASLTHSFTDVNNSTVSSEPLSHPDDITRLGRDIFVGFQNGVDPQGGANGNGNQDSTVVEMTASGQPVAQWDVLGKADGLTADPAAHTVIATVNEDALSSLYTITPGPGGGVQHYFYNEALPHGGGTDAISVFDGRLFVSASAPSTTGTLPPPQASFPAVYSVTLDRQDSVATVTPLFGDEDPAVVANVGTTQTGQVVPLALTDPDSSAIVPPDAPRFAGDFMLTSQGDQQQIFVGHPGGPGQSLSVLSLGQAVDDTVWPDGEPGVLYATDSTNDTVDTVTGTFGDTPLAVATPCGANSAPTPCPAPPAYPANSLASLDPWTGDVTTLTVGGVPFAPQGGLLFVPSPVEQG